MTMHVTMLPNGRKYEVKIEQQDKLEALVFKAKAEMKHPCVYHMLAHIHDAEAFGVSKRNLIRLFERKLKKAYKRTKQNTPNVLIAYSIEFKYTNWDEVEDKGYRSDSTGNSIPFLHIHFYVIADCCSGTRPQSFTTYARQALNEIPGLRKGRYLKSYFGKQYKTLLTEFDDTFQKLLYIAKVDQKSPNIPYRSTFGASRL